MLGPMVQIPFYIWIGGQAGVKFEDTTQKVPELHLDAPVTKKQLLKPFEKPLLEYAHMHGQGRKWRKPFDPKLTMEMGRYIYAFAWEDPVNNY